MILVILILITAFCYWAYWSVYARRLDKATEGLPVPPGCLPILGHATLFIGDTQKILRNLESIAEMALKRKGTTKIWLGPKLYVAIANPVDAQIVLENCLDKDVVYRFLKPWLGQGLFIAPLTLWKYHRRVLLPIFNNKVVEEYLDIISEQADVLIKKLIVHSNKADFDVFKYITACTLDIVFETSMGERMDVQHSPDSPYLHARHKVMSILNMRLFKVWLQPDCIFNLTPYAKQQKENIEYTHKFTDEVVHKRRMEQKELRTVNKHQKESKHISILDMLLDKDVKFTNEQLRENIDSITIAGNDTTSLVIAYTLVLLGIHRDVQTKVYVELESVFGDSERGATKEDLQKMHYLERVIKESMRLYTVVPIIARKIDKDVFLPHSGVTLLAGCSAVVGFFAMHRSKEIWGPDVNEFDPDRFLPDRSASRHPAAFLPFSYGPRNCIGRNFGMLIMKSILSRIVRSYIMDADDIGTLKIEMLLFPISGHRIKITPR